MITFPNAKINLGLNVVARRADGYHDIETVFLPIDLRDALEVVPSASGETTLATYGRAVDCPMEKNLVVRAYRLMCDHKPLPPVEIHLNKHIPDGAGLGGGSSDAAHMLLMLNEMFDVGLTKEELATMAARLGADCAVFVYNRPMLATGIGEVLTPIELDLKGKFLALVKPPVAVSTAEAYGLVEPAQAVPAVREAIRLPLEQWDGLLVNDFEPSVFARYPLLWQIKLGLLGRGARYAAMSGSGSTIYGIFDDVKLAENAVADYAAYDTFVIAIG